MPQGEGRPNREAFGSSTGLSEWPEYTTLLLRMFGIYGVAFSLLAIASRSGVFQSWRAVGMVGAAGREHDRLRRADEYDQIVRAVGRFQLSEYLRLGDLRVPRRHRSFPRRLVS